MTLSAGELEAYRQTFGAAFFPAVIEPLIWNEDHTDAFFHYSFGWRGGGFRLRRDGDTWKVDVISS